MTAPSLPEVRDSNGTVLLPATELGAAEPNEAQRKLLEKGLITWEDRWVTPRTGQTYHPDLWKTEKVHWHCFKTQGDPGGPGLRVPGWETADARVERVAKTPEEALAWLLECWETDLPRVPAEYRAQGEYEQRTSDEGRAWYAEHYWVGLCMGRTIAASHMTGERHQLRYHVEAQTPADCQQH